jgi:ABC-type arginine transport system ATPase subunit
MKVARERYDQILYIENGSIQWSGSFNCVEETGTEAAKEFILE